MSKKISSILLRVGVSSTGKLGALIGNTNIGYWQFRSIVYNLIANWYYKRKCYILACRVSIVHWFVFVYLIFTEIFTNSKRLLVIGARKKLHRGKFTKNRFNLVKKKHVRNSRKYWRKRNILKSHYINMSKFMAARTNYYANQQLENAVEDAGWHFKIQRWFFHSIFVFKLLVRGLKSYNIGLQLYNYIWYILIYIKKSINNIKNLLHSTSALRYLMKYENLNIIFKDMPISITLSSIENLFLLFLIILGFQFSIEKFIIYKRKININIWQHAFWFRFKHFILNFWFGRNIAYISSKIIIPAFLYTSTHKLSEERVYDNKANSFPLTSKKVYSNKRLLQSIIARSSFSHSSSCKLWKIFFSCYDFYLESLFIHFFSGTQVSYWKNLLRFFLINILKFIYINNVFSNNFRFTNYISFSFIYIILSLSKIWWIYSYKILRKIFWNTNHLYIRLSLWTSQLLQRYFHNTNNIFFMFTLRHLLRSKRLSRGIPSWIGRRNRLSLRAWWRERKILFKRKYWFNKRKYRFNKRKYRFNKHKYRFKDRVSYKGFRICNVLTHDKVCMKIIKFCHKSKHFKWFLLRNYRKYKYFWIIKSLRHSFRQLKNKYSAIFFKRVFLNKSNKMLKIRGNKSFKSKRSFNTNSYRVHHQKHNIMNDILTRNFFTTSYKLMVPATLDKKKLKRNCNLLWEKKKFVKNTPPPSLSTVSVVNKLKKMRKIIKKKKFSSSNLLSGNLRQNKLFQSWFIFLLGIRFFVTLYLRVVYITQKLIRKNCITLFSLFKMPITNNFGIWWFRRRFYSGLMRQIFIKTKLFKYVYYKNIWDLNVRPFYKYNNISGYLETYRYSITNIKSLLHTNITIFPEPITFRNKIRIYKYRIWYLFSKRVYTCYRKFMRIFKFKRWKWYFRHMLEIFFISLQLIDAKLLAKYIAYQVSYNLKHWLLLRSIKQLVNWIFEKSNNLLGLKLQWYGPINRIGRTIHFMFRKRMVPLQTFNWHVDFGMAHGYSKYGVIGVKIWLFF